MMRRLKRTAVAITSAVVIAHTPAIAQQIPSETWMGIYLGQAKIGYAGFSVDSSNFRGKPGYRLDSTSVTNIVALGVEIEQTLNTTVYLNKEFEPVFQSFQMSSAGHTTRVTASFQPNEIIAEVQSRGTKSIKNIPVPAGSRIVSDSTFFPAAMQLELGDRLDLKWFNPLTLSLEDLQTQVVRKEQLQLGDDTHETFVIRSLTPLGEMVCWQDENGELLKVTALMGITMIRETKEKAQFVDHTGTYTPPSDLAVMTSTPTTTTIPYPRQVKNLKIRFEGLTDESLAISDARQSVTYTTGDTPVAEYEITASEFDSSRAVSTPVEQTAMNVFLAESPYVQTSNPEIVALAREIAGDETNSYAIVSKLRAWVNANMQTKGDIGIVRSSVDVLRTKTGVCRDYAVLYTALARAAGIPTKLVAGLIYWNGGFYYHAWAESFVGEWIPVDATLTTDFVDATHIKLVEGDATAMFDMVKTMGSLKAEIIEFR